MPMHNICGCAGPGQFYTGACCLGVQAGSGMHCALPGSRHGAAPRPLLAPALLAAPLMRDPASRPQGDGSMDMNAQFPRAQGSCAHSSAAGSSRPGMAAQHRPSSPCLALGRGRGWGRGRSLRDAQHSCGCGKDAVH